MKIGILAVQGAFAEHITTLQKLNIDAIPVRLPAELNGLDGLIIPGGESTSINHLMLVYNLKPAIIERARAGMPVWGTCAGMILMAKEIPGSDIEPLGLMDITVRRNAFGRQKDSFETEIDIPVLGEDPFPGVFIRAPLIERVNNGVTVLSKLENGTIVAARQGNFLSSSFHPELTKDPRFHNYFLEIARHKL